MCSYPLVRSARLGDETAISKIHVASWQHFYRGHMPQDFLDSLDVNQRVNFWRQQLLALSTAADPEGASPKSGIVVVVDESSTPQEAKRSATEKILGFAMFGPSRDNDAEVQRRTGEVGAIYLQPGSTSARVNWHRARTASYAGGNNTACAPRVRGGDTMGARRQRERKAIL